MNAEGIGGMFTPEWLQAIATGLLVLVVAAWIPAGLSSLWRRTVWREAGGALSRVSKALDARIEPIWGGWRVASGALALEISGGLTGLKTRIHRGDQHTEQAGVPDPDVLFVLLGLTANG